MCQINYTLAYQYLGHVFRGINTVALSWCTPAGPVGVVMSCPQPYNLPLKPYIVLTQPRSHYVELQCSSQTHAKIIEEDLKG